MSLSNFIIPEELKEYIRKRSKDEYCSMTQYIIRLILKDKKEHDSN